MLRCDPLECILKPLVLETVELFAGKEFQSWVATLFKSWLPLIHFIHIPPASRSGLPSFDDFEFDAMHMSCNV